MIKTSAIVITSKKGVRAARRFFFDIVTWIRFDLEKSHPSVTALPTDVEIGFSQTPDQIRESDYGRARKSQFTRLASLTKVKPF